MIKRAESQIHLFFISYKNMLLEKIKKEYKITKLFFKIKNSWYTCFCYHLSEKDLSRSIMKHTLKLCIFYGICAIATVYARPPHIIVLTLKEYPLLDQHKTKTTTTSDKTSSITSPTASAWPSVIEGVYSSYFGYLACSNNSGQIIFPRKQQSTSFTLIVTQHIKPIFMFHNTISTWRVAEKTAYAAFNIQRIQDPKTGIYMWETKKITLTDKNLALPFDAIVIFAQPNEIFVPLGVTVTENSAQLVLPPLFIKNTINLAKNALYMINYRQFFELIERSFKIDGTDKKGVQSKFSTPLV